MDFTGILQFADRTFMPEKSRSAFSAIVFYMFLQLIFCLRVNSYTSLNRDDYLYLKVADLVIYLA